jgi:hypothetical protein
VQVVPEVKVMSELHVVPLVPMLLQLQVVPKVEAGYCCESGI